MPDLRSPFWKTYCVSVLLAMGVTSCKEDHSDPSLKRYNFASQADCALGDLGERSVIYNSDGLSAARHSFEEHFTLDSTKTKLKSLRHVLSMDSLTGLVQHIDATLKQVDAVKFHYGLVDGGFKPILQFMHQMRSTSEFELVDSTYYEIVNFGLNVLSDDSARAWKQAYSNSVWVSPYGKGSYLIKDKPGGNESPTSEWFRYTDHIVRLWKENGGGSDLYLVINCISEQVCYSSLGFLASQMPQNVHLIALNIRKEGPSGVDELGNGALNSASLEKVAVDLGHLCPPRCK